MKGKKNSDFRIRKSQVNRSAALIVAATLASAHAYAEGGGLQSNNRGADVTPSSYANRESEAQQIEQRRAEYERSRSAREQAERDAAVVHRDQNSTQQQKQEANDRVAQAKKNENEAQARLKKQDSQRISNTYGQDITNTEQQIETGKIVTQVSTLGGQTATAIRGQLGTQKAAMEGTQSAAMKQGASLSSSTGMINMAVGALNLWYAQQHYKQMGEHDINKEQLKQFTNGDAVGVAALETQGSDEFAGTTAKISNKAYAREISGKVQAEDQKLASACATPGAGCEQARAQYYQNIAVINKEADALAKSAINEQSTAYSTAKQAMAQNLITGSVAMLNGAATIAAANQMKSAAQKLQTASTYGNLPTYTPGQITGAGDPLGGGATTITGDGSTAATGAASGDTASNSDGTGGLGDPYALPQPAAAPSNTPDVKTTAAGGGAPGGGGGGGMGGANTSPNTGTAEGDPQARMADNGRGASYEGSGGGFRGGGAGGGKGGADLSSLLAQFLPKKEDETSKNGILDYKKRAIASDDSSLLDRNANLFERIHNTYQAKQKSRTVGVN